MLLFLPASNNKLLMQCQGPYKVVERVGDIKYCIWIPGQAVRLYHVNLLEAWEEPEELGWYQLEIDGDEESRE